MSEYNPKVADHYARHLSKVNETNSVLASKDIVNENGVLLIKKGAQINTKLANRVIRHKLTQPLEHSVNLTNVIDGGRLYKFFFEFLKKHRDCQSLHDAANLTTLLKEQCVHYSYYPLLTQKLTVLAMQRPQDFQKGLFCGWLSLAITFRLRMSPSEQQAAFLAGLLHDCGMLHISMDILDKKGALTAEEWRAIQSHPLIADTFLREVPGLPPEVSRAGLEHHERGDGTGYPKGRFDDELTRVGQVVALTDTLCAIRMLRFKGTDKTLIDLIPVLKLNSRLYDSPTYRAVVNLIREAGLKPCADQLTDERAGQINTWIERQRLLAKWLSEFPRLLRVLPEGSKLRHVRSAAHQLRTIWFAVSSSGVLSPDLRQWIEELNTMPADMAADGILTADDEAAESDLSLEEARTMLDEVHWQLKQLNKSLRQILDEPTHSQDELGKQVRASLEAIEKIDAVLSRR